jgi:uncharacterized protein
MRKEAFILPLDDDNSVFADLTLDEAVDNPPLIIFLHGFKGFKDWGAFNQAADFFASNGFAFLKFNFSLNGTTFDSPCDFVSLENFSKNTYTSELNEALNVIDYVTSSEFPRKYGFSPKSINLVGHSRGGGIAILAAHTRHKINKLATWSAVADFFNRFPLDQDIEKWKQEGYVVVENKRTGQQLPISYDFYLDAIENRERLNIQQAANQLTIPHLIVHGEKDEAVDVNQAYQLNEASPFSKLHIESFTGHTFRVSHPFEGEQLPEAFQQVLVATLQFFKTEAHA